VRLRIQARDLCLHDTPRSAVSTWASFTVRSLRRVEYTSQRRLSASNRTVFTHEFTYNGDSISQRHSNARAGGDPRQPYSERFTGDKLGAPLSPEFKGKPSEAVSRGGYPQIRQSAGGVIDSHLGELGVVGFPRKPCTCLSVLAFPRPP